jgi:hypothetical protein
VAIGIKNSSWMLCYVVLCCVVLCCVVFCCVVLCCVVLSGMLLRYSDCTVSTDNVVTIQ